MFGCFMPKEEKFFDLFNQHAEYCVRCANELLTSVKDFNQIEKQLRIINGLEKQADKVTYQTISVLHKTFITPFDREDIHRLITKMDDIVDLMEDAAQTISLYDIQTITPEAIHLAELCLGCCEKLKDGISLLHNMSNSRQILEICEKVDQLESEADQVMYAAMSKLFRSEPDIRTLIKLKALYEILENVTDICEDVANIIEGIVVENV